MLKAGSHDIVVSGGMESMSNAPYILDKARGGYRMGHGQVIGKDIARAVQSGQRCQRYVIGGAFAQPGFIFHPAHPTLP